MTKTGTTKNGDWLFNIRTFRHNLLIYQPDTPRNFIKSTYYTRNKHQIKKAKRITIHVAICFFVTLLIFFSHSKRSEAGTCNAEPTDMSVSYGQSITCDINSGSDTDTYRFSGKAKDRVIIEADWVSGDNFVPDIELIAPDGSRVTSTYYPYVIETNLSQTGTYTVIVSAHDTRYIGKYNLTIKCAGGSCLPTGNTPCSGPTLSSDMKMHIPVLNILTQSGWVPIWADFEYLPDQNGNILFKTVNYGLIK